MEDCHRCPLRDTCTYPVGGSGKGNIMFIGEAPGETEDKYNIPFIGLSGRLLRDAVGNDNYFTNAVKCRPPDNRKPTASEIEACFCHLVDEIEEVKPGIIVYIGTTSYSLHKKISAMYPGIPYLFFYHPAYALRTGKAKEWSEEIGAIIKSIKGD
jgi:uracil-DNA glycosylase family 4